jgi:TRAP transporter TAXI family solute receptor
MERRPRPIRGRLAIQAVIALLALAVLAAAAHWLEPLPPRRLVLAAGAEGGYYHALGERYRERLARDGITVTVRTTRGAVENLELLRASPPEVDVAFVQGGVGGAAGDEGLESLGSVFHEPAFVFARRSLGISRLSDLAGRQVAIGPQGSGTRALALALLAFNGLDLRPSETLPLAGREARDALRSGRIDAAVFVIAHPLPSLAELFADPALELIGFDHAEAYRMRFPYLATVRLPAGAIDLPRDIPPRELQLVAPVAALVVQDGLHSALKNLLARAARDIHGGTQLFAESGRFPAASHLDYPLNAYARRLIEDGPSVFARFLPFWVAVWGERILILLLPLLGLLLPLWRIGPPLYRWRTERRIYRWYRDLARLEVQGRGAVSDNSRRKIFARLDALDASVSAIKVPLAYARRLYELRAHIDLVRRRLDSSQRGAPRPSDTRERDRIDAGGSADHA